MSLINEALKRTRDASFQAGQSPTNRPAAYQISQPAARPGVDLQTILIGAAIVVAVVIVIAGSFFMRAGPEPVNPVAVSLPVPAKPPVSEEQLVSRLMEKLQVEQARLPPAPPPPPVVPPAALPKLTLQGIMRAGANSEAMINGYTYRVGDTVEGARLVAIEDGVVRLNHAGQEVVLRLR